MKTKVKQVAAGILVALSLILVTPVVARDGVTESVVTMDSVPQLCIAGGGGSGGG